MAQIDLGKIKRIEKERNSVHASVISTYTTFELDGNKYLQIDTYGKDGREMSEKISQSFQFDRKAAKYLVDLLIKEFEL